MSTDTSMAAVTAPDIPTISQAECATSSTDTLDFAERIGDTSEEMPLLQNSESSTDPPVSSTAYSFVGSALGSESTANLTETTIKKDTITTDSSANNEDDKMNDESLYECNICLDTAKDAVVSMCGHLFCWPCLHQWLETRPNRKLCPVCKAAIGKDKVIPLYGRNSTKQEDPRNKVPPRPAGQRIEPEPQHGFGFGGFGDGFQMSFGIGAFPFGYFSSTFNFGEQRQNAANRGTTQYEDEQLLSKLFLYLACMCIAWLLFA